MNNKNKGIAATFVLILIMIIIATTLVNYNIKNFTVQEITHKKISFVRVVDLGKKDIFNTMADLENYPQILPDNFVSIKILNKTGNVIYAESVVTERGITTKLLEKHTIIPYDKHVMEILSGDAKGTIITETYEETGLSTNLSTDIDMHLEGVLIIFKFLPSAEIEHAANTVITKFVDYKKHE